MSLLGHSTDVWLRGLIAAFISGGAGAVSSSIGGIVIAPETFNTAHPLKLLEMAGWSFLMMGLIAASNYLKQSPIPVDPLENPANGGVNSDRG